MGVSESKSQNDDLRVFDFNGISYDEFGNLVYEKIPSNRKDDRAKEKELREIIACEEKQVDDVENTVKAPQEWYIMDALWVELWLAYIYVDKDQPAPGPCNNYRLIHPNFDKDVWEGRIDMRLSKGEKGGDYRRVNKQTWDTYKKYYPGSGPEIKITEKLNTDGSIDMNHLNNALNWVVEELKMPKNRTKKAPAQVQRIEETVVDPVKSSLPSLRIQETVTDPVKSIIPTTLIEERVTDPVKSTLPAQRIEEAKTRSISPAINVIKAVTRMTNSSKSVSTSASQSVSSVVQPSISVATPAVNLISEGGDSDDEIPRPVPKIVVENRTADSDDD